MRGTQWACTASGISEVSDVASRNAGFVPQHSSLHTYVHWRFYTDLEEINVDRLMSIKRRWHADIGTVKGKRTGRRLPVRRW